MVDDHHACEDARATTAAPLPVSAALLTGRAWPAAGGLRTSEVEWHQADPEGKGYQRLDVGAFHAHEVAVLAMGWGWSQVGRGSAPNGVQLLRDPPAGEQVLRNLDGGDPADGGVNANVCASVGDGGA